MYMLSGQEHPDVLWQLENLFASYFLIQIVETPNATGISRGRFHSPVM